MCSSFEASETWLAQDKSGAFSGGAEISLSTFSEGAEISDSTLHSKKGEVASSDRESPGEAGFVFCCGVD